MTDTREYKLKILSGILELLGPSLYTNIYYVLAELIANAYDADASNVYIIKKDDAFIVEDDGTGMSYKDGDIENYLNVAMETRVDENSSLTKSRVRKKMGRKGVGKLAALSVSENVHILTKKDGEKSGFVLSRHVGSDNILQPLDESKIHFEKIEKIPSGTSIVMTSPEYGLHKTPSAIKNNLLKIFPLIDSDFKVHIITDDGELILDSFDKEIIKNLAGLIILGEEHHYLAEYFDPDIDSDSEAKNDLLELDSAKDITLKLRNRSGEEKDYVLSIRGWIGVYKTTKGRKNESGDFRDNFISLLSNKKLGAYDILDVVGKNKLYEVYVVGQLHVDLFEETELPDIALSNRQGYKTDDLRYVETTNFIRDDLLPRIISKRSDYKVRKDSVKNKLKQDQQRKDEEELRSKVEEYKAKVSENVTNIIKKKSGDKLPTEFDDIIRTEMNKFLPIVGLKKRVDEQKRKILISHASIDKDLADIVYKMLLFNGVLPDEILYTSSDNAESRIPNRVSTFDYLRDFFVDSISDEKIFVIYITSDEMSQKWFPVTEVGAGWITKSNHDIFNIREHTPQRPLDTEPVWHSSSRKNGNIVMRKIDFDTFVVKIIDICNSIESSPKSKKSNEQELNRSVEVESS